MQVLLILIAAGLLLFAGYSYGRTRGFDDARTAHDPTAPKRPGMGQTLVLIALSGIAFGGATRLQEPTSVRMPTPARLEELAGRAESVAVDKAEEIATEQSSG